MTATDPIAVRVALRHAREAAVVLRDVPAKTRVEYTESGRISAVALAKMLEPTTGFLTNLRFRPALLGTPNTVSWEALDERASIVSGKLALRAAVSDSEIVSCAVTVEQRVDPAAERVAREYIRRGDGLLPVDDDEEVGEDQDGHAGA